MTKKIGFARLSPEERAEMGRRGGRQTSQAGSGHKWDAAEAQKASRKRWRKQEEA